IIHLRVPVNKKLTNLLRSEFFSESALQNDILILENLDLRMVPAGRYQLVWLPMKLVAPDGAPVRAVLTKD
ncbi:MAG: hypothetical protein V3U73_07395, partial [bacterium]